MFTLPTYSLVQRWFALAAVVACAIGNSHTSYAAATAIDLNDAPMFSTVTVPGNLALALSVEWPTASSPAYVSSYSTSSTYIGYFDSEKCYAYSYNATTPSSSYFYPVGSASSHSCSSSSGRWSGNYMNWASMHTLDEFRWIMTGGNRSVDGHPDSGSTAPYTVLTKTYASDDASTSTIPNKSLSSDISTATPLSWSLVRSRTLRMGTAMLLFSSASDTTFEANTAVSSNICDIGASCSLTSPYYRVYINVAVCTSSTLKEDNCVAYGTSTTAYKPEGLMQKYASKLRYSAFGYLNYDGDSSQQVDGGVMRSRMNFIGSTKPVPGSTSVSNTKTVSGTARSIAEYDDVSTGVMYSNPLQYTDAADTNSTFGISISQSGTMNYLNKFGYYSQSYKSKDPVSELYYAVLRYYKGLANNSDYTSATTAARADGFPVITNWTSEDPIQYSCQKNFILGIGDVNTHRDANLASGTLRSNSSLDQANAVPTQVTSVDAVTATNMVGQMEGNSNLGNIYAATSTSTCASTSAQCNTYFIAGLAYDAHTVDLRSTSSSTDIDTNMSGSQTINTYWIDVLESQTYRRKNQYWLAAKYGGFTIPSSFSPYSSSNGTSSLTATSWYTNTDTSSISGITQTAPAAFTYSDDYDKRPDNYYFGNNPTTMKTGLTSAFSKILSELGEANSSAYSMARPNVRSGDTAYAATYNASTWTGTLTGYTVSYDSSGTATPTQVWAAGDLLDALSSPATSRNIVTFCDSASTPAGIAFTSTALSACTSTATTARLSYSSLATVMNVSASTQANYVAWLRGDRTHEISSDGTSISTKYYRYRKHLLGDIVNSKVTAVGAPDASYYDLYNPGYSSFKRTYATRRTVLYAGSNDGMLHAFDGTAPSYTSTTTTSTGSSTTTYSSCSFCGQELFGFIPSFAYKGPNSTPTEDGLAALGNPKRSHYFMVDATPLAFDMDFGNTCANSAGSTSVCTKYNSSTPDWRSVLIGGLGKGGKGFYAIDVTNPGFVSSTTSSSSGSTTTTTTVTKTLTDGAWTSEANIAAKILWEFPKSTDTTTIARMGYSYGAPTVVKTAKYGWVVIFTSGYNNSDGQGYFFFVNPRNGELLETVATTQGSTTAPLNLAHADAYIPNHTDFTADALYGGDMQGNVWRVDLTTTSSAYSAPTRMARLTNAAGDSQPVTTRPLIEANPTTGKRYVVLGTGRLLADSDVKSSSLQSIYSLYDGTRAAAGFIAFSTPLTRSTLLANTSLLTGIGSSPSVSTGWYYDLSSTNSIAARVNVDPVAYNGVAAFGVNTPSGSVCSPSGTGEVLTFNIGTGKSVLYDSSGNLISSSSTSSGVVTEVAFQNVNGTVRVLSGDSSGNVTTTASSLSTSTGLTRMNWREVPMQ
ncbi:pilus assembly protein [Curvibacter sp. CHRR-16]|uniref:pilus assembly protein n=1 Tax=Curvibacter sp. CHRR-16 TaxID=2835872 RepID=UPI001BDAD5F1|nr:PilC/PilY family type IV pilus protein [Curvibacter sp. CHRR-16]MBT0571729.1 pilus assembly protein [Curvibacter sp. CHRR-16]